MSCLTSREFGLLFATILLLGGINPLPSYADVDNRPIVVLREDDCRTTWRTRYQGLDGMSGLEYGKSKHIPITWAIVTSMANAGNASGLSWAELKDYLDVAGGEAASHSVTHAALASASAYVSELVSSKSLIEQNLPGYTCTTFLQPGSWTDYANLDQFSELDNEVGQAIQSNYSQSLAYLGGGWMIGSPYYKYGLTNSYNVDYQSGPSIAAVNATLDVVSETPGLIFVVSCHGIQETGDTQTYHVPANIMKALMDKLADLRDAGKIRLMGLNEAYHAAFSSDLNQVPDPGFEHCNSAANPVGPWHLYGSAAISPSGGVDNSRYGRVTTSSSSYITCGNMVLGPRRYELVWYQRLETGYPISAPLRIAMSTTPPAYTPPYACIANIFATNSAPGIWERKTALLLVKDQFPNASIYFAATSGAGYGVDNISLKLAPLDPAVSPTNVSTSPNPSTCKISWLTPPDVDVRSIRVRYSASTHPLSPTSGTDMGTVQAVPGTIQELEIPINWTQQAWVFFSVFAIKSDGSFSPPGLIVVKVDKTAPSTNGIDIAIQLDMTAKVRWSASDPESRIFQYQYAVGSNSGCGDVVPWTYTNQSGTVFSGLGSGRQLYLSVRAQNEFGLWSSVASKLIPQPGRISDVLNQSDNSPVSVFGTISAVFADCCYLEQADRVRGIKLTGNIAGLTECEQVAVSGTLSTENGQRAIAVGY
ncbi:MAG: polysaccharide deacetylase family protein [Armatimonadota bacterium]